VRTVRVALRALSALGWTLLGVLALAGVALSGVVLLASSGPGRALVARTLVRYADAEVAGHLELAGVDVLSNGGIGLRGFRAYDPDGRLVLDVDRLEVLADVTRVRNRSIGLTVELDGPTVLLEEGEDGQLSLARAFAPARRRPERPPREEGPGWTARIARLTVRRGAIWWVDRTGATRLEASGLELDGRGVVGPDRTRVDLALRASVAAPVAGPLSLEVRGGSDGRAVRVNALRVRLGDTVLEGLGQGDLAKRTGRAAITQVAIDRAEVRRLAPDVPAGADLAFSAYAESDGRIATGAVSVVPRVDGAGRAHVAAAARVDGTRALGFDLDLDRLDPARLHAAAPPGEVTARGHGAVAGASLRALRGRVTLALARSRLRRGTLGPGEVDAAVDGGSWTVRRLALAAPGISLDGSGAWRAGGPVAGQVEARGKDLAAAARNLEQLLGAKLPAVAGTARVDARLSGTADAPALDGTITAAALASGTLAVSGVRAEAHLAGPARTLAGSVDASADRVRRGGDELARALLVRATLAGGEAHLAASASVPRLGRDPVTVDARARRVGTEGEALAFDTLTIGYPGTRYALARPATLWLARGPRVDLLELAAGSQRIVLEGGLGPRSAIDARLRLEGVRLEGLPAGVLPGSGGISGAVSAELRASGTMGRPTLVGSLAVENGSYRSLAGLRVLADLRYDGATRRAAGTLALARAAGGTVDATFELPLPLGGRPGQRLALRLRGDALPVEEVLRVLDVATPASGLLALDARLEGPARAPVLRAEATLAGGAYADLSAVDLSLTADGAGGRLGLALSGALEGRPTLAAKAEVALDVGDLLARPERAAAALRTAPIELDVTVREVLLGELAGRLGLPQRIGGRLTGALRAEGTLGALRGAASLDLADGQYEGYAGIAARLQATAAADRVAATAQGALQGEELLRATASLGAPLERLGTRAGLRAAPLAVDVEIPGAVLARAAGRDVPVAGTLRGTVKARGTLAAPRIEGELAGTGLSFSGTALGDARARLRADGGKASAEVDVAAARGGTLHAALAVASAISLETSGAALRAAPAELSVKADALQLGFLPAVVPRLVRAASGRLDADVRARGPLGRVSPRGTARLRDGRLAISEYGDWTGIEVDAAISEDAVEIPQLVAHRGKGKLEARGSLRGMTSGTGKLEGRIAANDLAISRTGVDLATLTLNVQVGGTWHPGALDARLDVARGALVRLPKRTPRTLQPLEERPDIVVGPRRKAPAPAAAAGPPFALTLRVVAPGRLQVQGENPFVRVELKADVRYEVVGKEDYMSGTIEVVRGDVEPISGRRFEMHRGKVTFTGGPPKAALLDVEAVYTNPEAVVTVDVTGSVASPEFRLSSQPPMDDAQIALLIATGRRELKPGTGGVQSLGGQQGGLATAAGGVVATQLFRNVIQDRLPLDTVALDAAELRAGKYVTDRVYVGYTHRFDARPELGQNPDEVRVEYQITPRWSFEVRYGNAQSGGGSLIWSKNY
jgi:translocation and assembly module TamB